VPRRIAQQRHHPLRARQHGAVGQRVGGGQPDRAGGHAVQLQLDGGGNNPATAGWLRKKLDIDPSGIWVSLLLLLAVPMALGLLFSHRLPALTARIQKPLANFSLIALLAFIVLGSSRSGSC
jgi:hypothetical protein